MTLNKPNSTEQQHARDHGHQHSNTSVSTFQDSSTECAICLMPLSTAHAITLTCGHRWHLQCVQTQLRIARPDLSKRLIFTGYRCAKCSQFCEHPLLHDVTRPISHLRQKVDSLMLEQSKVDGLHTRLAFCSPDGAYYKNLLAYARAIYAFFLCSVCSDPFFGGTIECAENAREPTFGDRVCPTCSPTASSTCTHSSHTPFYIWKCRFCCNPAIFVCHGSTHFCDDCHTRDARRTSSNTLCAIECGGRANCAYPLANHKQYHDNGAAPSNEQVYSCGACVSDPIGTGSIFCLERGSNNMVYNRSGEHGVSGWIAMRASPWYTEVSNVHIFGNRSNFVSSFFWSSMVQVIDLRQFVRSPSDVVLEFYAFYLARTDCGSEFELEAAIFNHKYEELNYKTTGILTAPADFWDRARLILAPTEGACFALVGIRGKDKKFWSGNFGSKAAECSVRVLYEHELEDEATVMFDSNGQSGAALRPPDAQTSAAVAGRFMTKHNIF